MLGKIARRIIPENWRPIMYLTNQAYAGTNGTVYAGPFKGMHYIRAAFYSAYIPKLLGIYEKELNGAIAEACGVGLQRVVDVGAAEGYYAVGLARLLPDAKVVAYEMTVQGQALLREMCRINDVASRVDIRGRCDRPELQALLVDGLRTLVVCDCEGFEAILLDPLRVPSLSNAWILVEVHDFVLPGLKEELTDRFSATHDVQLIASQPREASEYPFHSFYSDTLPQSYRAWAVSEWRPGTMYWLWMRPKSPAGS